MKNSFPLIPLSIPLSILLFLLASCAGRNISVPTSNIYTISPQWAESSSQAETRAKHQTIIKLAPIRATGAFTSSDMLYSDAMHSRNSYAYSRWSDAPVRLLQLLFQTALEHSGSFAAVVPYTSSSDADYLLESTLYDFSHQIGDDGTSAGFIRVRFYLIDNAKRTVIATKEFESRVPASSQNAQSAAAALNKAANSVARDVVIWLTERHSSKK